MAAIRQGFSEFYVCSGIFSALQNSVPHFIHDTPLEQLRSDIADEAISAEDFAIAASG
ncbi:hypothetical protein J4727_01775 [Providencia rettgeri]|uniref:Uncharacterized protein n=1 Tax=Providencia rettgeri TaxID=587 RepID=A0A939SL72_PRORE|nr:hypothetical protein [Providencia rettgeri]